MKIGSVGAINNLTSVFSPLNFVAFIKWFLNSILSWVVCDFIKSLLFHETKLSCDTVASLSGMSWHINIFFSGVWK